MATEYFLSTHHVPTRNGESLIEPPVAHLPSLIERSFLSEQSPPSSVEFCGRGLSTFRRKARRSAIRLAIAHTTQYRSENLPHLSNIDTLIDSPIVMSGHQPEPFHCGVWFKNFLLSDIARSTGALGIHFLVDNDLCRATSISVPTRAPSGQTDQHCDDPDCSARKGLPQNWSLTRVPFDSPRDPLPWENCRVQDLDLWNSFPSRVLESMPPIDGDPLIARLWNYASRDAQVGDPIGLLLSKARHGLEAELGLQTLEVPLSRLTETEEFASFSVQLLSELPRLHETYNAALDAYRGLHRIRNHAQPLPNLARVGDWYEAPWWIYRRDWQTRDALWIQKSGTQVVLSNRSNWQTTIDTSGTCQSAASKWMDILREGVCLRPRALLTTMYARLILSDLFIHGVGGARYDQLTDRIIADFFGLTAPPLVLATITMHLPFQNLARELTEPVDGQLAELQQTLRVAQSNPEVAFDQFGETESMDQIRQLTAQKKLLLANIPPRGEKWEWHSRMKSINEQMNALAGPTIARIKSRIQRLECLRGEQEIVLARDFSHCLFPEKTILSSFSQAITKIETPV